MHSDFLLNKQLNETEFKEGKVILQSKPRFLRVILTNLCNINCIMCGSSVEGERFVIPYEALKQIIGLFPYLEFINWQGGEVFLVDYFKDILIRASNFHNIQHEIQTNGLLLDEEWIELLVKQNTILSFSIDGTTRETYEYIRKRGNFEKLLENILLFNRLKQRYNSRSYMNLCVCIMKSNYRKIEEFVEFAKRYGFQQIVFGFIKGNFVQQENIFDPPDPEAVKYLRELMPSIERTCHTDGIPMVYHFKPILQEWDGDSSGCRIQQEDMARISMCRKPWLQLLINGIHYGNVYPDCMCQKSIGNIMREDILDMWNGPYMQQYRQEILNGDSQSVCSDICNKKLTPEDYFV